MWSTAVPDFCGFTDDETVMQDVLTMARNIPSEGFHLQTIDLLEVHDVMNIIITSKTGRVNDGDEEEC